MMDGTSEARERVLDVAERLFTERGYTAVTLRDIAAELGMRQASLYYHVPGGKEELFVTVTERGLARHQAGLEAAIAAAPADLRAQLRAAARWLLSQPPMDWGRMMRSDMPAIGEAHGRRLTQAADAAVMQPIARLFQTALQASGGPVNTTYLLAGMFVASVGAIHDVQPFTQTPHQVLANKMIDVLLDGVLPPSTPPASGGMGA